MIKCRIWNKELKCWCYGWPITLPSEADGITTRFDVVEGYEVVWYTDLKDEEEREIYEGDIIENYYFGYERAVVIFRDGAFYAEPRCYSEGKEFKTYPENIIDETTDLLSKYLLKWKGSKVIGNIRMNPELLEAKP